MDPSGTVHKYYPLGAQVNRYESTVAYVYTQGSTFAYAANRLCREQRWDELFDEYGKCLRCLWSYGEKMQARYGGDQPLFRGMNANWAEFKRKYFVGAFFEWQAFTSTSTDREAALAFAKGKYANASDPSERPVLFCIKTQSRGAPLLRWSKYPNEDEVLLLPFQRFHVEQVSTHQGALCIVLQTVAPVRKQSLYEVICTPGGNLGYRYSRHLDDRDDRPKGPSFGSSIKGAQEGANWVVIKMEDAGERFLPMSINGIPKLRRRSNTDVWVRQASQDEAEQKSFVVCARQGLAYRLTPSLRDRDDNMVGEEFESVVSGIEAAGWLGVMVPGVGVRFLPTSIDGEPKLLPLENFAQADCVIT